MASRSQCLPLQVVVDWVASEGGKDARLIMMPIPDTVPGSVSPSGIWGELCRQASVMCEGALTWRAGGRHGGTLCDQGIHYLLEPVPAHIP